MQLVGISSSSWTMKTAATPRAPRTLVSRKSAKYANRPGVQAAFLNKPTTTSKIASPMVHSLYWTARNDRVQHKKMREFGKIAAGEAADSCGRVFRPTFIGNRRDDSPKFRGWKKGRRCNDLIVAELARVQRTTICIRILANVATEKYFKALALRALVHFELAY